MEVSQTTPPVGQPNMRPRAIQDWRHVQLTTVARLESGHTPSKRMPGYWGGEIPWISLHDTEGLDAWEISNTRQTITEAGLANSSARLLPKGTVVFSRTATVGKATVMGQAMATSQDFACYICGPEVHNFYLSILLRSMRAEWKKLMAGSIHNTVYMPVFKTLQVNLPPVAEQVAIASAMFDAEQQIDSLEKLLTKKRQIKQGAVTALFSRRRRLPGFTEKWGEIAIGDFTDCTAGGTPSTRVEGFWGGDIPWMSSGELHKKRVWAVEGRITDHGLKNSSTKWIPERCVLIGLAGQGKTRGTVAMNMIRLCTNQSIAAIFPSEEYDSDFLFHNLDWRYDELRELSAGDGGRGGLNLTLIRSIVVPLPPRSEQRAIAILLSDMDTDIATIEARLTKARALKQAMAQALLTGRIRLMEPNA